MSDGRWARRVRPGALAWGLGVLGLLAVVVTALLVVPTWRAEKRDPGDERWARWPTRGDLARDSELVERAAESAARAEYRSADAARVLWIGRTRGSSERALAVVAVELPPPPGDRELFASLHRVDLVGSTRVTEERPLDATLRAGDLAVELPALADVLPPVTQPPVLTASDATSVEYRDAGGDGRTRAEIRADGLAFSTTPAAAPSGCASSYTLVSGGARKQVLQTKGRALEIFGSGSPDAPTERLLVSLLRGLQCGGTQRGERANIGPDDLIVAVHRIPSGGPGLAWPDGRGTYQGFTITLRTRPGPTAAADGESAAVAFGSGAPAVIGVPRQFDGDVANAIAVRVSGTGVGSGQGILALGFNRQPLPVTVPALPVQLDAAGVLLFGPPDGRAAVIELTRDGEPNTAQIVDD